MIDNMFSIPLYSSFASDKLAIEKELFNTFKKLNFFNNDRYPNSHKISDPEFVSNFLQAHNCNFFLKELDTHLKKYLEEIGSVIKIDKVGYRIYSWMTLNFPNGYTAQHSHGAADISGVYYLKVPLNSGNIFFKNPNKLLSSSICFYHLPEGAYVEAIEGKFLLFPGWLEHGVLPNNSADDRISISFNIIFNRN
jgi:uncharacterized protein (TIGR02466 family)